jgi:hypothetical protein
VDDGTEPVADDELLYRRISVSSGWYLPDSGLSAQAFAPHKTEDATGLSVHRSKYKTLEQAATGRPGKSYYVAVLRAGDLRQRGIEVMPRPLPDDPGHAELPALNSDSRKSDRTRELQRVLVELSRSVEGPFGPS